MEINGNLDVVYLHGRNPVMTLPRVGLEYTFGGTQGAKVNGTQAFCVPCSESRNVSFLEANGISYAWESQVLA